MLGRPDEDFHVASRNLAAAKDIRSAHLIHYAPQIERLTAKAPLRLNGPTRRPPPVSNIPTLTMTLEEALASRSSSRTFSERPMTVGQLWKLCYVASGVRQKITRNSGVWFQRNVPNSGGLGSVEVFPIALCVDGLPHGVYHFDSVNHEFVEIATGDFRAWLDRDVLFQTEFAQAAVALVLVGSFARLREKYGPRGYRSALIDVGHCSENIYLAATALGLGVCATTGFIDDELDDALRLNGVDSASLEVVLIGNIDLHLEEDRAGVL